MVLCSTFYTYNLIPYKNNTSWLSYLFDYTILNKKVKTPQRKIDFDCSKDVWHVQCQAISEYDQKIAENKRKFQNSRWLFDEVLGTEWVSDLMLVSELDAMNRSYVITMASLSKRDL